MVRVLLQKVATRTVHTVADAPRPGEFCRQIPTIFAGCWTRPVRADPVEPFPSWLILGLRPQFGPPGRPVRAHAFCRGTPPLCRSCERSGGLRGTLGRR